MQRCVRRYADLAIVPSGRFWPKAAAGIEWRVAALPPKAAAELEEASGAAFDPKRT